MAENRFLQSFCAVAASSVLVCGTLLLLTSTAPWTPPDLGPEPPTPDAVRNFAEDMPPLDNEAAEETVAALGSPLNEETADAGPETDTATEIVSAIAALGPNTDLAVSPEVVAGDRTEAATDEIGGLLAELPPRVIARDMSGAAAEQVATLAASLPPAPPPVIASEKTGPAAEEVAGLAATLPPAPRPLHEMAEPVPELPADVASAQPVIEESEAGKGEFVAVAAAFVAMPAEQVVAEDQSETLEVVSAGAPAPAATDAAGRELAEVAVPEINVVELTPPPLPRRKPEMPAAPSVAEAPAPATVETPAVKTAVAPAPLSPARERPAPAVAAAQEAPRQTGGGLLGIWKPMALAPADKPVAPSKPATARPSSGAYASQVWARLARHKPRAGQRGSASVSFTIGEMGALRVAQIARSSGNARIDQLALQTVRSAAPFPAPPSGAVSYTIRIDFQ